MSQKSISYFDSIAAEYFAKYAEDSPAGYALRVRKARVLEVMDGGGGRVLDVGCGPGVMVEDILNLGCEFWGLDASPHMIDESHKQLATTKRAHFVVGDAARLPFPDEFFDTVLCMGVIGNLNDSESMLQEMLRIVKKGGTLLIALPNFLSPYATWKIVVFYPVVALLRPIYYGLIGRLQPPSLYNLAWWHQRRPLSSLFTQLHTARIATQLISRLGSKVTDVVYFNFNLFLSPLDELFPLWALEVTKRLERLRFGWLKWLGCGFILKAHKHS